MKALTIKQNVKFERVLIETKVKNECEHKYMFEDFCMICQKVLEKKRG